MKNKNTNKTEQNGESAAVYAAKLSFIGSSLYTIGIGLQTLAEGIELQELINTPNESQTSDQASQLEQIQIQLDYLIRKIESMERRNYRQF